MIRSAASSAAIRPSSAGGSPTATLRSARSPTPCSPASRARRCSAPWRSAFCDTLSTPAPLPTWPGPSRAWAKTRRRPSRLLSSAPSASASALSSPSVTAHTNVPRICPPLVVLRAGSRRVRSRAIGRWPDFRARRASSRKWGQRPMAVTAQLTDDRGDLAQRARGAHVTVPTNPAETLPMSAEGYEYLCRELDTLRDLGRRELGARLRDARGHGDLADNPMLQDLLEEQAQLERRIAILDAQLAAAEIITP